MDNNSRSALTVRGGIVRHQWETKNRHRAFAVWLTGLPASGKTTLARLLEAELFCREIHCCVLDGDILRQGLTSDLGFSREDRSENIRRAGEVARLMVDAGLIAIAAFISPYRSDRALVRTRLPEGGFYEIYLDCPLSVCESRDPKGLYRSVREGKVASFTGISDPYEPPFRSDLVLQTGTTSLEKSFEALKNFVVERCQLPPRVT